MKPQINALTSTRGFAAIMVYIFHFAKFDYPFNKFPGLFLNGNLAVSYFFVLSGFVLYFSYAENSIPYQEFMKKRIARIAPVYLLALSLSVAIYLFINKNPVTFDLAKQIVYSTLFIQAYFPSYALCLNVAAWSISAEMLFYLSFPFLLALQKEKTGLFIVLTILVFIITQVCFFIFFSRDNTTLNSQYFFLYNPVMHVNQFLIGMTGGCLFKKIGTPQKKYSLLPFILLCVIIIVIALKPGRVYYDAGLIAPVFMIFIISVAVNNPKFLNIKPLIFLGEISYGIYILQFPVQMLLNTWNNQYKIIPDAIYFYCSLGILIFVAALSYYFFEKPLRNKINRAF